MLYNPIISYIMLDQDLHPNSPILVPVPRQGSESANWVFFRVRKLQALAGWMAFGSLTSYQKNNLW